MNIYNTLYFLEYSKEPTRDYNHIKIWYLNLSKDHYWLCHRDFDLYAFVNTQVRLWIQYNKWHRLLGPAHIDRNNFKAYYIRNYSLL